MPILARHEDFRREAVHRIANDVKADSNVLHDFRKAQHT